MKLNRSKYNYNKKFANVSILWELQKNFKRRYKSKLKNTRFKKKLKKEISVVENCELAVAYLKLRQLNNRLRYFYKTQVLNINSIKKTNLKKLKIKFNKKYCTFEDISNIFFNR